MAKERVKARHQLSISLPKRKGEALHYHQLAGPYFYGARLYGYGERLQRRRENGMLFDQVNDHLRVHADHTATEMIC